MTIEGAIVEYLLSLSPVTALVATRAYQMILPQSPTWPAVRVQQISDVDDYHLRGPGNVRRTRIQVDAFGTTYASVAAVADAINGDGLGGSATGLSGFVGDIGGSPAEFHIAFIERLDRRPEYTADELRIYRMRQDYRVHWWVI